MDKRSISADETNEDTKISQYLTFLLQDDVVGINLDEVKEVREVKNLSVLPGTPAYMRGVTNLRGQIIPVIDLKRKFGMGHTKFTVDTCIVIVEIIREDGAIQIGALADSVCDVVDLLPHEVDPAPKMGSSVNARFIHGMGKHNDEFFSMLNTGTLFSRNELLGDNTSDKVSRQLN